MRRVFAFYKAEKNMSTIAIVSLATALLAGLFVRRRLLLIRADDEAQHDVGTW